MFPPRTDLVLFIIPAENRNKEDWHLTKLLAFRFWIKLELRNGGRKTKEPCKKPLN